MRCPSCSSEFSGFIDKCEACGFWAPGVIYYANIGSFEQWSKQIIDSVAGYESAIEIYDSISGWKNADEQIYACQKSEEIKAKEEADRLTAIKAEEEARKAAEEALENASLAAKRDEEAMLAARQAEEARIAAEKAAKKQKKIATIVTQIVVVIIAAFIAVAVFAKLITVIIPNEKYDSVLALIENGYKDSVQEGKEIFSKYKMAELKAAAVGDVVYFGSYEQDNNQSNGKEDIEWLVLAKEGNNALVISKYALDCQKYETSFNMPTWETCSLRKWLNTTFLSAAFTSEEQTIIINSTVTVDKKTSDTRWPGNNTIDKVFLLSITEADKYFSSVSARQCQGTAYCYAQGPVRCENGICWWWLRSPGGGNNWTPYIGSDGYTYLDGHDVTDYLGVRPALWINYGY